MLVVAASSLAVVATNHWNSKNVFSRKAYDKQYEIHMATLAQLDGMAGGNAIKKWLRGLYKEFTGASSRPVVLVQGPAPKLAIPQSALRNYGVAPKPQANNCSITNHVTITRSNAQITLAYSSTPNALVVDGIDVTSILQHPTMSKERKLKLMAAILEATEANPPSHAVSNTRASCKFHGLLTKVNNNSDDSKVQAWRAGALSGTGDQAIELEDDNVEMKDDEGGKGGKGGEGGKFELESHTCINPQGGAAARAQDVSMKVLEDEGDEEDEDNGAPGECKLQIFMANGDIPINTNDEEDESDGKGKSGAVAAKVNPDDAMLSEAEIDDSQ
ncbi:hypothetical protein FRC07_001822 [Ceratobasidium sp. 392]|nr:hypothetical protein FRC07_001822 [Ceratobasidium sp. 392]